MNVLPFTPEIYLLVLIFPTKLKITSPVTRGLLILVPLYISTYFPYLCYSSFMSYTASLTTISYFSPGGPFIPALLLWDQKIFTGLKISPIQEHEMVVGSLEQRNVCAPFFTSQEDRLAVVEAWKFGFQWSNGGGTWEPRGLRSAWHHHTRDYADYFICPYSSEAVTKSCPEDQVNPLCFPSLYT